MKKSFGVSLDDGLVGQLDTMAGELRCSRSSLVGSLLNEAVNPSRADVVTVLQNPREEHPLIDVQSVWSDIYQRSGLGLWYRQNLPDCLVFLGEPKLQGLNCSVHKLDSPAQVGSLVHLGFIKKMSEADMRGLNPRSVQSWTLQFVTTRSSKIASTPDLRWRTCLVLQPPKED